MDRFVTAAWRAVWVALGASTVLVAQALLAPAAPPVNAADIAPPAVQEIAPTRPQASDLAGKTVQAKARSYARSST